MRHDRLVPGLIDQAVENLRSVGVRLDRGLSHDEVSHVQARLDFTFGPEHRHFIQSVLPVGESWPDWRNGADEDLRSRLDWPVEGVLYDVRHNGFWPCSWGPRPRGTHDRERDARAHLSLVPKLVPIYSHRYLASDPRFEPSPVFSVHQTDVVVYGDNLLDYVAREFRGSPSHRSGRTRVPFWSALAEGAASRDV